MERRMFYSCSRRIFFGGLISVILCFVICIQMNVDAKVRLNVKSKSLCLQDTYKLQVKGASGRKISYYSNKPKVVSVSKKGVLKAKKEGSALITAKVGKQKLKCRIKVTRISSGAMKYLKGTWERVGGRPSVTTVTFTKKRIKFKFSSGKSYYAKLVSIKATSYGYFIRVEQNGDKWGYRLETKTADKNGTLLNYVYTWNPYSLNGYSGSSSLEKVSSN